MPKDIRELDTNEIEQIAGAAGQDTRPCETINLNFDKVIWKAAGQTSLGSPEEYVYYTVTLTNAR